MTKIPKTKNEKPLTTVSGKFHVGMTAQEAKKKDLYKSVFSRDFTDIDKNADGKLSAEEICDERDHECAITKERATGSDIFGGMVVGAGVATSEFGVGILAGVVGAGIVGAAESARADAEKEQAKTQEYRIKHGLDTKM